MRRLPASQARERFSELLNEAAHGNKRTLLQRHGKDVAAVISADDFRRFEELERSARRFTVTAKQAKPAIPASKRRVPRS